MTAELFAGKKLEPPMPLMMLATTTSASVTSLLSCA